jgi:hypothetical protein
MGVPGKLGSRSKRSPRLRVPTELLMGLNCSLVKHCLLSHLLRTDDIVVQTHSVDREQCSSRLPGELFLAPRDEGA